MFACLLKIQLAAAGVGTSPSLASLITDAELTQINWEFSMEPSEAPKMNRLCEERNTNT